MEGGRGGKRGWERGRRVRVGGEGGRERLLGLSVLLYRA